MIMPPKDIGRYVYDAGLNLWRDYSLEGRRVASKRVAADRMLAALARSGSHHFSGTVLVDGTFDNPNYWLRYSLLRAALGLAQGNEIGVIGPHRRKHVSGTFARLGVKKQVDFALMRSRHRSDPIAEDLIARTRSADDVLRWQLPGDVHPSIVYDNILKRQRLATLDIVHPGFSLQVKQAIRVIERAIELLDETRPDLVIVSHPFTYGCGSLAWLALKRGIPVVLPFGHFGVLRFVRFEQPEDLFSFYDRPTGEQIDSLPVEKAAALADIGRRYIESRLRGGADDLAAIYAYRRHHAGIDRASLCAKYGWDPHKPIVAFYASNWFDWPHQLGMTQFRDFLDWTELTFAAAQKNTRVNWLFKPHPEEAWFGGISLKSIVERLGSAPHIAVADSWNNSAVIRAVDALITYHGTAGIEFATLGKPVLVPDRGKYDLCGFVKLARSRQDYLELLSGDWWSELDLAETRRRAEIFSGLWLCAPDWQGKFLISDDPLQDKLYDHIPGLLTDTPEALARELATIRSWWKSKDRYYHTYKMLQATGYHLSNVTLEQSPPNETQFSVATKTGRRSSSQATVIADREATDQQCRTVGKG